MLYYVDALYMYVLRHPRCLYVCRLQDVYTYAHAAMDEVCRI